MNATSRYTPERPEPSRKQSHLRICRQLIEMGMDLARIAAARASAELANPQPADAEQLAESDPMLEFSSLADAVLQTIALEASIAGGAAAKRPSATFPPDPRRLKLRAAIANATQDTLLRLEMNESLDCALAADPAHLIPLQTIIETIAEEYDLDPEDLDLTPGLAPYNPRPFSIS